MFIAYLLHGEFYRCANRLLTAPACRQVPDSYLLLPEQGPKKQQQAKHQYQYGDYR
jgi:hypothetical protein